jgi:hypothetical protein
MKTLKVNTRILPEQNAPRYFALTEQPIGRYANSVGVLCDDDDVRLLSFLIMSSVSMDGGGDEYVRPSLSPCIQIKICKKKSI